MTTSVRLAAFAVGTLAAFGAAFGLGRVVGPIGDDRPGMSEPGHMGPSSNQPDGERVPTHPTGHEGGQP